MIPQHQSIRCRPATASATGSMCATCYSKKVASICSPFPAWLQTPCLRWPAKSALTDRKSTRLNSSHVEISYAVFCLKKKKVGGRATAASIRAEPGERRRQVAKHVRLVGIRLLGRQDRVQQQPLFFF